MDKTGLFGYDVTMFYGCGPGRSKVGATFTVGDPFVSGFAKRNLEYFAVSLGSRIKISPRCLDLSLPTTG